MTLDEIVQWYQLPRTPDIGPEETQECYFQHHPRTAYLKMLPRGAEVADIGAGDGSLSIFREWPEPKRKDLRLHAYSIDKGERFDAFDTYEISDWNHAHPEFGGRKFDGVVSAHFIEHITDPLTFFQWLSRKLKLGGTAYVEWPSERSLVLPSKRELDAVGVSLIISRFDDDDTHQRLPDLGEIKTAIDAMGLMVTNSGIVRLPWLEHQLLANFRDAQDRFPVQAAFWSWTSWAQFLVVEKVCDPV